MIYKYKYNGIGEKCPVPLINMRLLLKKMRIGDSCIITINDTGSLSDIPKLLAKQGYQYHKQINSNGTVDISISV